MTEVQETWRSITGFPGYEVSDRGSARSYWIMVEQQAVLASTPRLLNLYTGPTGHRYACFQGESGQQVNHQIGNWMLRAFVGPPGPGEECRHLDDNPQHNHLVNLRWGTRLENVQDRLRNGRHNLAKLTPLDIPKIREMLAAKIKQKDIATIFNVSVPTISEINTGKIWAFVPEVQPG